LHSAGFTGIDDPYEPPVSCEVRRVIKEDHACLIELNVHKYVHALDICFYLEKHENSIHEKKS
jgi:adenylylsulfate kinase-like enzyme